MKRENLYLVNCFLDRETEVLGNKKAISLQLKLHFKNRNDSFYRMNIPTFCAGPHFEHWHNGWQNSGFDVVAVSSSSSKSSSIHSKR